MTEENYNCVKCASFGPFVFEFPDGRVFRVCRKHKPAADAAFDKAVAAKKEKLVPLESHDEK